MEEFSVKLYVYDLSQGLARSLSPMLLGHQIDGIWHTAIVVFDQEFYFGGQGIEVCSPGGTILGNPNEIVSLGSTQLPLDIFMQHLEELSASTFKPECYHLLNHNCNTFSDEVAQFLTGLKIPSHITSLPQDVLQTPFGAMIKPIVDAMSVSPGGGHSLFGDTAKNTNTQEAAGGENTSTTGEFPQIVLFNDKSVFNSVNKSSLLDRLSPDDVRDINEVYEYITASTNNTWSLRPLHLKVLCRLIVDNSLSIDNRKTVCDILRMAMTFDDVITVCDHDLNESFMRLLKDLESVDSDLSQPVAKTVCNFVSTKVGAEKFVREASSVCRCFLLNTDPDLQLIGSQITSNMLQNIQNLSEDLAFDLGIALVECCQSADSQSAEYLWFSFCTCIRSNAELAAVATTTGLDVALHENKFPVIIKYTRTTRKFFS